MEATSLHTQLQLDQVVGEFEAGRIAQGVLLLAGMLDTAADGAERIQALRDVLASHPLRRFLSADPALHLAATNMPQALALIASGAMPTGLSRCGDEVFRAVAGLGFARGLQERRALGAAALEPAWRRGERIALIDCGELGELDRLHGTALDNIALRHSDAAVAAMLQQQHGLSDFSPAGARLDLVLASGVADLRSAAELIQWLIAIAARLAPQGVLYLSSFTPGHLGCGWQTACLGRDLVCHDETGLERCAASAGLTIRHMRGASGSLIWGELRHAAAAQANLFGRGHHD